MRRHVIIKAQEELDNQNERVPIMIESALKFENRLGLSLKRKTRQLTRLPRRETSLGEQTEREPEECELAVIGRELVKLLLVGNRDQTLLQTSIITRRFLLLGFHLIAILSIRSSRSCRPFLVLYYELRIVSGVKQTRSTELHVSQQTSACEVFLFLASQSGVP